MNRTFEQCDQPGCGKVNTARETGWVQIGIRNKRQEDAVLQFCPAHAAATTLADVPALVDPPKAAAPEQPKAAEQPQQP